MQSPTTAQPTGRVAPAGSQYGRLERAARDLDAPFGVVDLEALAANADDLVRRAAGTPIRVASKSIRVRAILDRVLARPGYRGVLAYSLREALWLGLDDIVIGYPTTDRGALRELAADPKAAERITLMVDSVDQLDFIDRTVGRGVGSGVGSGLGSGVGSGRAELRLCLDLDASLRPWGDRLHLGPRRSPLHSPEQAGELARVISRRPGFRLVGLMAYEGQVAGLQDRPKGQPVKGGIVRALKKRSVPELAERRTAAVAAVRAEADLEFVNGGGTGSIETTVAEPAVTEVAAGSGLFTPGLFDGYDAFRPDPAAFFALEVGRRPARGIVTLTGGGWVASGPAGRDRLPIPTYPAGLSLIGSEGAGEVQTPLTGAAADGLAIGDRVWFRHAKAGELCERLDELHLVEGDEVTAVVPTYRGEGKTFL
jgi:D-serine deaminase-like pyridoxal phosphate-dependent protein